MDVKAVGERMRQQRKIKGLTQKELAEKVNLSTMSIRRYEGGERIITEDILQRIAENLGCDLYWLLWGETPSIGEVAANNVMRAFNTDDYRVERTAQLAVYYAEAEYKNRGYSFSDDEARLVASFSLLNPAGQEKAMEAVDIIAGNPDYQKEKKPPQPE